jgi:hypothetical protein
MIIVEAVAPQRLREAETINHVSATKADMSKATRTHHDNRGGEKRTMQGRTVHGHELISKTGHLATDMI